MKTLVQYINEFKIGKDIVSYEYKYTPTTKKELIKIIKDILKEEGPDADLNEIDVSKITNMSQLFYNLDIKNIDISQWDVKNVTDMSWMFYNCDKFNCNLSGWDVSNVKNMDGIFYQCKSFSSNISNWNIKSLESLYGAFDSCNKLNCDLSSWDLKEVSKYNEDNTFNNCNLPKEKRPKYKN